MINVTDINVMKPLLASHGFHFSKAKGQKTIELFAESDRCGIAKINIELD